MEWMTRQSMCGICGAVDFRGKGIRAKTIQKMTDILAHRGPDDEGMVFFRDGKPLEVRGADSLTPDEARFEVGLGHRRLAIIDLSSAAHQPMCNEDGSVWIVYNGEIYNFQDLRKELEGKGHLFKSNSDTEVILHAYEEWDVECLKTFRGMFAIAIWDNKRKRLFMARDRLGKKPLVYCYQNGQFAFASEIKALLQIPWVEQKVNNVALHHYLTYQYVPSPDTIFEGIKKIPPAHYLLYDRAGNLKIERYWKLNFKSNHQNHTDLQELEDRIRTELEESVKLRLISDVPLGAFLSGGVDSSLVVGIMTKLSGKPVKTFSIGFEEKEFDELSYARLVSNHFSTEHHEFIVKPDAIELLPKLVWHYNEPFADSSAIPTYYVANLTKDFVKVVLTGDAGDENFAGYRRYLFSKWVAFLTKVPEKVRKDMMPPFLRVFSSFHVKEAKLNRLADFLEMLTADQAKNYAEQIKIFNGKEKEDIYTEDFRKKVEEIRPLDFLLKKFEESGTEDLLEQLLYVDINSYLPEDLLVKMDIATMANSLEARVPFLDHKFMELVAGIPSQLKLKGKKTKFILKKAFRDLLPHPILKRKKMGFGVPVSRWFRKELKDYIYEILLDPKTLNRGYFKREGIERLLNDHIALRYDHSAKIWALLFLEMWFRVFMDGEGDYFSRAA
jgi:asparagine synthase (glutamine-hydrolysing)